MKNIEIIGGGTISHVRNHLALCAPAYGTTARRLYELVIKNSSIPDYNLHLHLTRMASPIGHNLETNEDVSLLVDQWIADPDTKIIFFNPALVDFNGAITTSGPIGYEWSNDITTKSGKYEERLKTSKGEQSMLLWPSGKILGKIRKERKDIFLVAFKTTCGATEDEQFLSGLHLLKSNSCNLVLANDTKERRNMIITPEQARYCVTTNRDEALKTLVDMAISRSEGHFTRSNVVPGHSIPWDMETIPHSLKAVVDHCIAKGAYKTFNGSTVGHFAFKKNETDFITSKRRADFNQLEKFGMVLCRATNDDEVVAFGAKPSVGGQSQRIVFKNHPEMDCIVHFHCPVKYPAELSVRSQASHECGSHECGQNTSNGLREEMPGIKCVYLDNHGPNIVFNHRTHPGAIIKFIDDNFDLTKSTDQVDRSQVQVS
jgi:hypothetical protein